MRVFLKNKRVHILSIMIIAVSLFTIHIVNAVTAEPGTPEDPLVSQSYVDSKIAAVTAELNNLKQLIQNNALITALDTRVKTVETNYSALDARIKTLENDVAALKQQAPGGQGGETGQAAKYVVIGPLQPGSQIIAGESTEIVLRSGAAAAIASEKGGVADLIEGKDLQTGDNVPLNHLLLVPRNDGRGIKITGDKEAWVLIRGAYSIR